MRRWGAARLRASGAARRGAVVALTLLLGVAGCEREKTMSEQPVTGMGQLAANTPEFSGDSAYALVEKQVSFGPRVPNTAGHEKQRAWMEQYLRARADTLEVRSFTARAPNGDSLALTNFFARFRPDATDRILLLAHWDTRPTADYDPDEAKRKQPILGANDGASGVAVLMRLADVLNRHSPPIGVDLLFVDGEDYTGDMYLGSVHFAANMPTGYRPLYGILLDMVGDRDPAYLIEPSSEQYAPGVVERVWRTAEDLGYGQYFPRTLMSTGIEDDHIPLNKAGIHTIDVIDFEYGPGNMYWHTLNDTLAHTSPEGLGVVGNVVTALIFRGG